MKPDFKGVDLKKVWFSRLRFLTERELADAPCIVNHMELTTEKVLHEFAVKVKSFMLAKEWRGETKSVRYPATWWDHAKHDLAPAWFVACFPVRWTVVELEGKILKCCPHSTAKWPDAQTVHLEWLVGGPQ